MITIPRAGKTSPLNVLRRVLRGRDVYAEFGTPLMELAVMWEVPIGMSALGGAPVMILDGRLNILFDQVNRHVSVYDDWIPVQSWAGLPPSFEALAELVATRLGMLDTEAAAADRERDQAVGL